MSESWTPAFAEVTIRLADPWADTGTSAGRLMIAALGGLADVERDLIRTRTAEGRSRAQKRGQRMGRPSKLTDAQKAEARPRRAQGATLAELAGSYRVARARFLVRMNDMDVPVLSSRFANSFCSSSVTSAFCFWENQSRGCKVGGEE